jgi:hypothetical protein
VVFLLRLEALVMGSLASLRLTDHLCRLELVREMVREMVQTVLVWESAKEQEPVQESSVARWSGPNLG